MKKHGNFKEFSYSDVLALVKSGYTISESCKAVGIHTTTFYNRITDAQKNEIISYKISNSKSSNWSKFR